MMFLTSTSEDYFFVMETLRELEDNHNFEEWTVITTTSEKDKLISRFLIEVGADVKIINFNLFNDDNLLRQLSEKLNCFIIIGEMKSKPLKTLFRYCDDRAEFFGNKISFREFSKTINAKLDNDFENVYEAYSLNNLPTKDIYKIYIDDYIKNAKRTLIQIITK